MTVEELIAKLGYRYGGQGEIRKFIADADKARAALKKLSGESKGLRLDFKSSGSGRLTSDLQRSIDAARRLRKEMAAVSRISIRGPGGPSYVPGRSPHERIGRGRVGAGEVAGGVVAGNIVSDIVRGTARVIGKPLVTFANEETARKQLELTANVPAERVSADFERFRSQAADLGTTPKKMLEVANAFVAAGLKYEDSVEAVTPTVKAAKAGFAPIDDVAKAGIATLDNLKVPVSDLGKAFDIMLASGKAGQVEMKDLPGILPEVLAAAQKAGYKGLQGLTDVSASLQFARKSTSTAGEAGTNAKNFYEKIYAPVTKKKFEDGPGINIEKLIKAGEKQGITAAEVVLREVNKYAKGDQFKAKGLFEDVEAGSFVTSQMQYKDEIAALVGEIKKTADGMVNRDFANVMGTLASKFEQLSAATSRLLGQFGEWGGDTAKEAVKVMKDGLEGFSGRQVTDAEYAGRLNKINAKLGLSPGYNTISGEDFADRFGSGAPSSTPSFIGQDIRARLARRNKGGLSLSSPSYAGGTAPTLGGSFGLSGSPTDWMRQGAQKAVAPITNNYNNTNTGNDQRTQTANVTVNASGLEAVGAAVLSKVQAGLSSMGASVVKGNTAATGASTAP
jgi:TP901 family phage tail tape measure protein